MKPQPGEAFSSWLMRGERSKNPIPFIRAHEYIQKHLGPKSTPTIPASCLARLAKILSMHETLLKQEFPTTGNWLLLPDVQREYMCEQCLISDFRQHRQPAFRGLWAHVWYNVCQAHGCIMQSRSTVDPCKSLFNTLNDTHLSWGAVRGVSLSRDRYATWQMSRQEPPAYKLLKLMAYEFQRWYLNAVRNECFATGVGVVEATQEEFELFMSDILAVVGKKRQYPYDARSYISVLLDIKGWSTLSGDIWPDSDRLKLLCLDPAEHDPPIRMSMFALLGLFLKIHKCSIPWRIYTREKIFVEGVEKFWWGMGSELGLNKVYYTWLLDRSQNWAPAIRRSFAYLLTYRY
jgi:hypothetical protein